MFLNSININVLNYIFLVKNLKKTFCKLNTEFYESVVIGVFRVNFS